MYAMIGEIQEGYKMSSIIAIITSGVSSLGFLRFFSMKEWLTQYVLVLASLERTCVMVFCSLGTSRIL